MLPGFSWAGLYKPHPAVFLIIKVGSLPPVCHSYGLTVYTLNKVKMKESLSLLLLTWRLISWKIPTQISYVISYQDCIWATVCMTLPILNRRKAIVTVGPVFKLNAHLVLCGCHFYQAFKTASLCCSVIFLQITAPLVWFLVGQLRLPRLSLSSREKMCLVCTAEHADSCVNDHLAFMCLACGEHTRR